MNEDMMKRYCVRVLGCKVNQYEARQIEHLLDRMGLAPASAGETAGVAILHGCAVTNMAARKSRQALRKLRTDHPNATLIMSGCGAAINHFDAAAERCHTAPSGEYWLQNLEACVNDALGRTPSHEADGTIGLERFSGHKRAFLKIQDGCSIGCTYCIVPTLRGGSRDKPLDELLHEAEALTVNGYTELVVTGVSVGLYGMNGGPALSNVLRGLLRIPGIQRLRMSSLHPQEVSDELLEVWSSTKRMMPHVHLPLQSGSTRLLAAMRRGYTAESFLETIQRFCDALDRPAFTTDVITGFPGETKEDFEATRYIIEETGFSGLHVFPYSNRPGTPASRMKDQVPAPLARKRAEQLQQLGKHLAGRYFESLIGTQEEVLVEQAINGRCTGHGERYFPVAFPGPESLLRGIVPVRLTGIQGEGMTGESIGKDRKTDS